MAEADGFDEEGQIWEVVGGGDKGGIMVREGIQTTSAQEADRLSTGALVRELQLVGDRLSYERLTGTGPERGWVSTRLKDKALLEKTEKRPTEAEAAAREKERELAPEVAKALAEAKAAMAAGAKFEAANDAFTAMAGVWSHKSARPQLLLARGLLLWRWSLLGKAQAHLKEAQLQGAKGAAPAALALKLCLSQWPLAREGAEKFRCADVLGALRAWDDAAAKMQVFVPEAAAQAPEDKEVMPGVRQTDLRIKVSDDAELGARLLLQVGAGGKAATDKPLVLCFHREDETVDAYVKKPENFAPLRAAGASALIVGYRGFGFSTGEPSLASLQVDGDRVCDALPGLFKERDLPWPWPGRLALFGSSLGSRVACYLAGMRGPQFFDGGVVIDTAWCGSGAPGAEPAPEPKEGPSLRDRFHLRVANPELAKAASDMGSVCRSLLQRAGVEDSGSFCYVRGTEDLLRGFDGRLLILHGEQDMAVVDAHARRLCDAAESATRKLVTLAGKGPENLRADAKYAEALKTFLSGK
mmetsp:Transcript_10263/g.32552  ORF Transcript_10263/g.32552 Transcript_10263/m.32552 type:complete len:527 (-) Transcript_10263:124-1704(-)